jgi:hypothetical protein
MPFWTIAEDFTTGQALRCVLGGAMVGAVTSTNLFMTGRITGISGFCGLAIDSLMGHAQAQFGQCSTEQWDGGGSALV